MGSCVCIKSKKQTIYPNYNKKENLAHLKKKNEVVDSIVIKNKVDYFKKISRRNWVVIINFLKFNELKEAIKVNR
jgi:hypothetical protein